MARNKEHFANIRFLRIEPQCRAEDEPLADGFYVMGAQAPLPSISFCRTDVNA